MMDNLLDGDGYPTEITLKRCRELTGTETAEDILSSLELIWHWPHHVRLSGNVLELHTGGWSGNEDVIEALSESMFWLVCWMESKRGGHHRFDLSKR